MNILTVNNVTNNINSISDEIQDLHFCILDCSDEGFIDHYFIPLVFLDSYHYACLDLKIGDYRIQAPMNWSILVCDEDLNEIDVIELKKLNDRGFRAVTINPFTSAIIDNKSIEIDNIYFDVKWHLPRLGRSCLLVVPLCDGPNPPCVYMVDSKIKLPKTLDLCDLL